MEADFDRSRFVSAIAVEQLMFQPAAFKLVKRVVVAACNEKVDSYMAAKHK